MYLNIFQEIKEENDTKVDGENTVLDINDTADKSLEEIEEEKVEQKKIDLLKGDKKDLLLGEFVKI